MFAESAPKLGFWSVPGRVGSVFVLIVITLPNFAQGMSRLLSRSAAVTGIGHVVPAGRSVAGAEAVLDAGLAGCAGKPHVAVAIVGLGIPRELKCDDINANVKIFLLCIIFANLRLNLQVNHSHQYDAFAVGAARRTGTKQKRVKYIN